MTKDPNEFGAAAVLGDEPYVEPVAAPVQPPRHPGQPEFPAPGIYFGMPEEEYHAIPAASTSHLKQVSISTMDAWAESWMNLDRPEREDKPWFNFGSAIHKFVLEGEDAYDATYAVDLDPADHAEERPLIHTAEIRAAIGEHMEEQPVAPRGGKQDLIDQLAELGTSQGVAVNLEGNVAQLKDRIRTFTEPQPVVPVRQVEEEDEHGNTITRPAAKADWIAQLLELDPEARVWDAMLAAHREANPGREMIDAATDRRVRIAVKMVAAHPEIGPLFKSGYPEVSLFYYCPRTGAPMKARLDYLRLHAILDLKSFSNKQHKPVDRAVTSAIASMRYNLQHVIYDEAVEQVKALIREHGEAAIGHCDIDVNEDQVDTDARDAWCMKWAQIEQPPAFIFVFQKTGLAPVTRGVRMPRVNMGTFGATQSAATRLKNKWVDAATRYGTDPWLDLAPITELPDEDIPLYATDM